MASATTSATPTTVVAPARETTTSGRSGGPGASVRPLPRSSDDIPTPLGPYSTVSRDAIKFATTISLSRSRPKKRVRRAWNPRRQSGLVLRFGWLHHAGLEPSLEQLDIGRGSRRARDVEPPPERLRERTRRPLHGPRAVRDRSLAPDPVEDQPQIPVGHLVAEEQEVAPAKTARRGRLGPPRSLRAAEVVDVVVLGDDEALPLAFGERSTARSSSRTIVRRSRTAPSRTCSGRRSGAEAPPGGRCQKRPRCGSDGDVGDDVDCLTRLLEGAFEREVVVRRHDELVRRTMRAQERRESREKTVKRPGRTAASNRECSSS